MIDKWIIWWKRSAHTTWVGALKYINLEWVVEVDRRVLDLQNQNLTNRIPDRHHSLVIHVLLQLQIHEELHVCLAVHEVLSHNVIRPVRKALVRDGFHFQSEVEIRGVFERDWRHPYLVLLGWHFDHAYPFISLIEIFNADNLGHLALGSDRQTYRLQVLQLDLQHPFQ